MQARGVDQQLRVWANGIEALDEGRLVSELIERHVAQTDPDAEDDEEDDLSP